MSKVQCVGAGHQAHCGPEPFPAGSHVWLGLPWSPTLWSARGQQPAGPLPALHHCLQCFCPYAAIQPGTLSTVNSLKSFIKQDAGFCHHAVGSIFHQICGTCYSGHCLRHHQVTPGLGLQCCDCCKGSCLSRRHLVCHSLFCSVSGVEVM